MAQGRGCGSWACAREVRAGSGAGAARLATLDVSSVLVGRSLDYFRVCSKELMVLEFRLFSGLLGVRADGPLPWVLALRSAAWSAGYVEVAFDAETCSCLLGTPDLTHVCPLILHSPPPSHPKERRGLGYFWSPGLSWLDGCYLRQSADQEQSPSDLCRPWFEVERKHSQTLLTHL